MQREILMYGFSADDHQSEPKVSWHKLANRIDEM